MKKLTQAVILAALGLGAGAVEVQAATINKSFCVGRIYRTFSGVSVALWGYKDCGTGGANTVLVPGPLLEIGAGDTLNLSFSAMMPMGAMEPNPYHGHTIHLHGADVPTSEDGVPETNGNMNMSDTYTWNVQPGYEGSHMYHCHVHTVKHLEMGMYGAMIVRPRGTNGAFLNQLNTSTTTAYDYAQTYVLSAIDPAYHTATGDSTVFADYNPVYFLINGIESKTTSAPAALTLAAAKSKKVAFRLIGLLSVNSTFTIKDASGVAQPFTVYIRDGKTLPTPKTVTSWDVSPGQRADLIATTPATAGTWYPQVTYKYLRANADGTYPAYANGTVYGKVTF